MTNERLKEILQMVLESRDSDYLCIRFGYLIKRKLIKGCESDYAINYLRTRRPKNGNIILWWGFAPCTFSEYSKWLKQKHDWLQKLIDEL